MSLKNAPVESRAKRVLWIAPVLNHYKSACLHRLAERSDLSLTVLAGQTAAADGHRLRPGRAAFTLETIPVPKARMGLALPAYARIANLLRRKLFQVVLMPAEKKFLPLVVLLSICRPVFGYRLVTYNHPLPTQQQRLGRYWEKAVARLLYRLYDRVVFYTHRARQLAVSETLVPAAKAFYANNTLDTTEIWDHYKFEVNPDSRKMLLFIGRLLRNKRLDLLFRYYDCLSELVPGLRLTIIGDGPEAAAVETNVRQREGVAWCGALISETEIGRCMQSAHLVFVPGHSGLSVVHAFCYGKPYATIRASTHAPEIDYLEDEVNGLLLEGEMLKDCRRLAAILRDDARYARMCEAAYAKSRELAVERWCEQMANALVGD